MKWTFGLSAEALNPSETNFTLFSHVKFFSYSSTSSLLQAPAHHLFKFYFRLRFVSASTWQNVAGNNLGAMQTKSC